jgi:hypothetical protein
MDEHNSSGATKRYSGKCGYEVFDLYDNFPGLDEQKVITI